MAIVYHNTFYEGTHWAFNEHGILTKFKGEYDSKELALEDAEYFRECGFQDIKVYRVDEWTNLTLILGSKLADDLDEEE